VHSTLDRYARKSLSALLCTVLVLAGCHHNNLNSGYGVAWVTLGSNATPNLFTSYTVNVDSVSLTGVNDGLITALSTVETVDFTKLKNFSQLWGSATIPNDTYTSATIILDYTSANISVNVNGVPTKATVVDTTGGAVTTQTITITFDPQHPLIIEPTTASSDAQRLAINFDLTASNVVGLGDSPPFVVIKPILTASTSAPDSKQVLVRGPLVNSSLGLQTYSIYIRPFYDEVNTLGQLTMFNSASTVYIINGTTYTGSAGLNVLSQLSAGTTMTEAYTQYVPSATLTGAVTAALYKATFIVAGSTLEDYYTQGLEGDVISREGNSLKLRGSTLQLNDGTSQYNDADALVVVGPSTLVTAENNTTLTALNYNSISVGQHIIVRGIYTLPASGVVTVDATGDTSTNTGSVRIQSTQLAGTLNSTATASLSLDLATIEGWPVSIYNFAGNGAAAINPADYVVDTAHATVPAPLAVGAPLLINGFTTPFGSAPPDFNAFTINTEASAPASLQVDWTGTGNAAPFASLSDSGLSINLAAADVASAVILIGAESIDMKSLPASPTIVPQAAPAATPGLPSAYLPSFAIGNLTSTADSTAVTVYNEYASFVSAVPKALVADPALRLVATGVYNRSSNTFTATSINVVN
jgi:hypothetical protein